MEQKNVWYAYIVKVCSPPPKKKETMASSLAIIGISFLLGVSLAVFLVFSMDLFSPLGVAPFEKPRVYKFRYDPNQQVQVEDQPRITRFPYN